MLQNPDDGDRSGKTHRTRAARGQPFPVPAPAKLARPRLHDIAGRERLFSLLDERCERPLIWIFGPPGAGKTTLVASYLHARRLPGIWYQADVGDGDPATLFYYLHQSVPSSGQVRLPLFAPEYPPDPPGFARRFFRELFARLPRPAMLVLDNFHEVPEETPFRAIWREAATQIPEGVNLLIVSCLEPPAEYARLQVSELLLLSWLALLRERPRTALEHARKSAGIARELASVGPAICALGVYSRTLAECGEPGRAIAAAREATAWVSAPGSGILRFNALLFEADALRQHGQCEESLAVLAEAFATGHRGGLLNCAVWLPKMMARLCADALAASIETEYVELLIHQRGLVAPGTDVEQWPWPVRVYTLGRFALVLDGQPLKATGKPQHRPLELLKALIALGGREVHGEALIEALWPDASGLGAQKTLQITARRLRDLLGSAEALRVQDGKLTLDAGRCWVDVWALERALNRALNRARDALAHGVWDGAGQRVLAEAQRLYQGHFLVGEPDQPWLIGRRERLRERLLGALSNAGQQLERARRFPEA